MLGAGGAADRGLAGSACVAADKKGIRSLPSHKSCLRPCSVCGDDCSAAMAPQLTKEAMHGLSN